MWASRAVAVGYIDGMLGMADPLNSGKIFGSAIPLWQFNFGTYFLYPINKHKL
jgi:hypothetical protein